MAQVRATVGAQNLDALHAERGVLHKLHGILLGGNVEAWPSAVRVKLCVTAKQFSATRLAVEDTLTVLIEQFACPGTFCGGFTQHSELIRAQFLAPLVITFRHLEVHCDTPPGNPDGSFHHYSTARTVDLFPIDCQNAGVAERSTADWYRAFGEVEAHGQSPLFEEWALGIAEDAEILALISSLPLQKRQPNLVFATARFLGAPEDGYASVRAWLLEHWPAVANEAHQRMTQTNEPRRCAAILIALGLIAERIEGPIALLELGASAGLCLYPDRYSYRYGDGEELHPETGPSAVQLDTEVVGPVPIPTRLPEIVWRAGIDLRPLDVANPEDVRWLETLVWPEQTERLERIRAAVDIVRHDPPVLVRGNAIDELDALAAAAPANVTLVVITSAMLVYLPYPERMQLIEAIRETGGHGISLDATGVRPKMDAQYPHPVPGRFTLSLDGVPLADVGPHGQFIDWLVHPAG